MHAQSSADHSATCDNKECLFTTWSATRRRASLSNGASSNGDAGAGVLICDDNDAMRSMLGAIVGTSFGMQVVGEAADGNEAVVQARRLQPDVILLDLAMPIRSGLEALPELRQVAPDARIIVFSGFARSIVADEVIALGADGYLEKGADLDKIVDTIEQVLATTDGSPTSLMSPA